MKGVTLKIRNKEKETAADIINLHFQKMQEEGAVYYSTNVAISKEREIEQILFYFMHQGKVRFVTADVLGVQLNQEGFIPYDTEKYSPMKYKNEPKVTWFLLKNMKEVTMDYINDCKVNYTNGDIKPLWDVIEQPRINRVYYSVAEKMDRNVLIK